VECAEAENQIHGVNADDGPRGEQFGQDAECATVERIVEGGHEHGGIADIKVGVTGGEAEALEVERAGHGQTDDMRASTVLQAHGFQAFAIFFQDAMVGIAGIAFLGEDDGAGIDETAEIVDVAVGVVAGDAAAEPENVFGAEKAAERRFNLRARKTGVAHLNARMEQAFLRGEQSAAAVDVNAAAFENEAATGDFSGEEREAKGASGMAGDLRVATPIGVFGPGIEAESDDGERSVCARGARIAPDEDGAGIAGPAAVGREREKPDATGRDSDGSEGAAGGGAVAGRLNDDVQQFAGRKFAADFRVDPGDDGDFAGPVRGVVRPAEPRGGVRFPLGGHAHGGTSGYGDRNGPTVRRSQAVATRASGRHGFAGHEERSR